MNLFAKLRARTDDPVRVALVGAGKFGTMFLHQARRTPGLHLAAVCDLSPDRARAALKRTHWPEAQVAAASLDAALASRTTFVTDDTARVLADPRIDVMIEATGNPAAGIAHARMAFAAGTHAVMVNVEADCLAGPALATEAAKAGVVYSLAYGDQPALVCELVDTLRAAGFEVVAAGKGTKYLPEFHRSTPETVWGHYGLTEEQARAGGMNKQMFNSFLDGTKSAIEMAAIANATGLAPPEDGLAFPPCGCHDLPRILRPRQEGGVLSGRGMVEVVSSVERDGRPVFNDLRWGVYAVFAADSDYDARCFAEYGVVTDPSGRYAALWRPYHFIGLELGVSVASVALRGEPTGAPTAWRADVVAVAKRALKAGEVLDGEGGATVWGKCVPAARSAAEHALPIGLAHRLTLRRDVAEGAVLSEADVALDPTADAVALRRAMAPA